MIVIVGFIVVIGAVLGGFVLSGGHVGALIQPFELLTIGGAALGGLIVMSSKKILVDLVKGILGTLKGSKFNKQTYRDLFKLMYTLLRLARRDGLLALESHVSKPHDSKIFHEYPRIANNHHVTDFICGAFGPVLDGTVRPEQLPEMLEAEINVIHEEHHAAQHALQATADALPGFGIVAAVLGIVITMESINGPVEEIGHHVGTALVGTFLGILMSYGFFGPLAARLGLIGAEELVFFRAIASIVSGFAGDASPKVAIERACRGLGSDVRPSREELDQLFKEAEGAG
jgi:chemotaxis protein MotA